MGLGSVGLGFVGFRVQGFGSGFGIKEDMTPHANMSPGV